MDAIDKAIQREGHISSDENLNGQSWQEFEEIFVGKKLFLFGCGGGGAEVFAKRYHNQYQLTGVIDNDAGKQGKNAGDYVVGVANSQNEFIKISTIDILDKYNSNEIVVLINSILSYEEIFRQLKEKGIGNLFVILIMEANWRKLHGNTSEEDAREKFAAECFKYPIEGRKIVFQAFNTYADHGKYITKQLLKTGADLDIVWFVKDMETEVPRGVRLVYVYNWEKYIYEMETAKMWVFNTTVPMYIKKREGQILIQTKHWASVTLKRFNLDSAKISDVEDKVGLWKYNAGMMDYVFTGSKFDTDSCRRGFQPAGEIVQLGSCRTDALFYADGLKEKVYKYYGISKEVRTALYAPTYRFKRGSRLHITEIRDVDMDYAAVKRALEKRFGGEWYILLRYHPGYEKEAAMLKRPDYVVDVSGYDDSQELVAASEIMISDYSSIMFEPAFVGKPVFLFATDREEYINGEYDVLIEYDTLPFDIAENNEGLVEKIERFDEDRYMRRVNQFMKEYGVHEDGHASERAAGFIIDLLGNQKKEDKLYQRI